MDSLKEEMMWLANKVFSVRKVDFSSEERIRCGLEHVRHLASLGLEMLSGGSVDEGVELLHRQWLEMIFRWGVTETIKLRSSAEALVLKYGADRKQAFCDFLNAPYGLICKGLFQTVPQYYDADYKTHEEHYRDFQNAQDLERAKVSLEQLELLLKILHERMPKVVRQYQSKEGGASQAGRHEVRLYTLLGTLFVRFVLAEGKSGEDPIGGKIQTLAPLTKSEVQKFIREGFEARGKYRGVKPTLKGKFHEQFLSADGQGQLVALMAFVYQELEEELGQVRDPDQLKPIHVSVVSMARSGG